MKGLGGRLERARAREKCHPITLRLQDSLARFIRLISLIACIYTAFLETQRHLILTPASHVITEKLNYLLRLEKAKIISQHFTERSRSVQYTVVDLYNDFANLFPYYGYFTAFVQTK